MKRTVGWLTTMTLAVLALTSCGDAPPGQITDSGSCETGSLNCGCYGNETCDLNLTCVDGQCIDERVPPANPKCYTPCKRGAVLDGIYRVCEEDGLMEGCIGGAMCVDGTCILPTPFAGEIGDGGVADGGVDDGCTTDEDCPGFQTCIQSNCYSDCEIDEDCSEGDGCYLRVCRPLCEFENTACPAKSYCATADGETGYCMPMAATSGKQTDVEGSFLLSTDRLSLSNMTDSASFTVFNNAPMPMKFIVRKVSHTELTDDGAETDEEMPLFWTRVASGGVAACEEDDGSGGDGASGNDGGASSDEENVAIDVLIEGQGATAELTLCDIVNDTIAVWNGVIEVGNDQLGYQQIRLDYKSSPDGQWSGKIYYFANFGADNLDEWLEDKTSEKLASVGNALIWRWAALRRGQITLENFRAALTSTKTGSWSWATVQESCPEPMGACYPYKDEDGMESFTNDIYERPIPSGMAELPVTLNLRVDPDDDKLLKGKIVSSETLHYAGDPAIQIALESASNECVSDTLGACLNYVSKIGAEIVVGGRYLPDPSDSSCKWAEDFEAMQTPWLVPGFTRGVTVDPTTGVAYRRECRDTLRPFDDGKLADLNASLAGANPVPDGRSRVRELEIIDGAMINQETLLIFFKEVFSEGEAADEATQLVAYGIMQLERQPATLDYNDFDGALQNEDRDQDKGLLTVQCSEEIVEKALGLTELPEEWNPAPIDPADLNSLVWALVDGMDPLAGGNTAGDVGETIHYLCHDTGLFDGGENDDGLPGADRIECPEGSNVTFFALPNTCMDQADFAALSCQLDGSCGDTLTSWHAAWQDDPTCSIRVDPFWRCTDPDLDYCDDDRLDLREGKTFYAANDAAVFLPIKNAVDDAFRYKTAFQNRENSNVGFSPDICVQASNSVPYCYDPPGIEEIEDRVNCALDLFVNHRDRLGTEEREMLGAYLNLNFAVEGVVNQKEGFEALFAELLIMLGDEAYTQAFASRFDLAGIHTASFEGELFEPDGINLSGVAGQEMYSLYQGIQYYQFALDRFYSLLPMIRQSLEEQTAGSSAAGFITQETVTNYLDRLIRASTQKSRAWSEVAKRYQNFNNPELARLVIERAYTATYMESVLITRIMHQVTDVVKAADEAQILLIIDKALKRYKAELLDMRDVYKKITDEVNYFGYSPDYIPFPAMDPLDINAFEKLLRIALQKSDGAKEKELKALADKREFDTNSASFQAELVRIRNTYENQLADLCGVFYGPDGNPLPAITKYAYLHPDLAALGDPCGFVGSGEIHDAIIQIDVAAIAVKAAIQRRSNKRQEIKIEMGRAKDQCSEIKDTKDYVFGKLDRKITMQSIMGGLDLLVSTLDRQLASASTLAQLAACEPPAPNGTIGNCPTAAIAGIAYKTFDTVTNVIAFASSGAKLGMEIALMVDEKDQAGFELNQQCDAIKIDSEASLAAMALAFKEIELDIISAGKNLQLAFSRLKSLRDKSKRLQVEQAEAEEMAINVEAARNDPNARIYKNDAIINADAAFETALKEAYKATKVFEYYTSQSWERLSNLFLVRMIQAGDYSLESYLADLEAAYFEFEEEYGVPDMRVAVLSLRDDILSVPTLNDEAEPLSQGDRIDLMREHLVNPDLLDANGYITIPFATSLDDLSPLTRVHKIVHIEADMVGSDVGDMVGRLYLKQLGTGVVRTISDEMSYYVFPDRTAVVDPFFNGNRIFDPEVYRNQRFRDRPLVNTAWHLVINQRDEKANKDINLNSLSDIRFYIYYTDFTQMEEN